MRFAYRVVPSLVTAIVLMMSTAQADTTGSDTRINADIVKASTNQVAVGFGVLHQDYQEYNDGLIPELPAILNSETGNINSFRVAYTGMFNRLYVQGILNYSIGNTDYTGYLQTWTSPTTVVYTPYNSTTRNNIFDLTGRIGYTYRAGGKVALIPYLELGEHLWNRELSPSTPYGYTEVYFNLSLGFGAKVLYSPIERLVLEIGAGYGTNLLSTMTTGGYDFTLGDMPYVNAYISADYRIDDRWHLALSANYRNWQYGESDMVATYTEPHSETTQTQYLISLGYSF